MQISLFSRAVLIITLLLLMGINQVQAATFSIDRAEWNTDYQTLFFKGYGEPFTSVELYVAGTDYLLASTTVYNREIWRLTLYNPTIIPCSVRAESGGTSVEAAIAFAPTDCVDADTLQDGTTTNNPPVISGTPPTNVMVGNTYSFTPDASDADGDTLSFSISGQPAWASFNSSSGTLSGTPTSTDSGVYSNIVISVTDGTDSAVLDPFSITVVDVNSSPIISGTPATNVTEGELYSFTPTASDPDGDALNFSISGQPAWASFNSSSGTLSGTPTSADIGVYSNIVISVSDGTDLAVLDPFSITVTEATVDVNSAPIISGTPATNVTEGELYSFTPTASDPDGDALSFSISGQPAWASFNSSSGTLSGTPTSADIGVYSNIVISLSDGTDSAMLDPFSITVTEDTTIDLLPGAPVLTSANLSGTSVLLTWVQDNAVPEGGYDIIIDNVDTNTLYRTTLLTTTIPDIDTSVPHCFAIQARYTDTSQFLASNELCTEAIAPVNAAPVISGVPPISVVEGELYSFTPTASDPDGDTLSFSISGQPAWASFNSSSGTLSGTPTSTDSGVYSNIVISVSDGTDSAMLDPFSITVTEDTTTDLLPGAPVLTSANLSGTSVLLTWIQDNAVPEGGYDIFVDNVDTGTLYRTTLLTATIPDFDTSVSHCFVIEARYTDTSQFLVSNELCTEAIAPVNTAPIISGIPTISVVEGELYSFTPTASDPDGDTLTFSIAGQPSWANFNTATGTLSGTPISSDVGLYQDIIIQVSDGVYTTSMNPFSITVEAAVVALGSANLTWIIPTTRTDGSALTLSEIGGYRIWMGTSNDNLQIVVDINEGSATSHTVSELAAGTYFFAITTYDIEDNEGPLSNIVSKTIM